MLVKIDTKAHFRILRVITPVLYANMAEELYHLILENMAVQPRNIIMVLEGVSGIDNRVVDALIKVQDADAAKRASFVITGMESPLAEQIKRIPPVRQLKFVSTFTEAVDLVMMEELERELSDSEQ